MNGGKRILNALAKTRKNQRKYNVNPNIILKYTNPRRRQIELLRSTIY